MDKFIVIVEDGNELYQPLGLADTIAEATDMADEYIKFAHPDNPDTEVPPMFFYAIGRNQNGFWTRKTLLPR